MSKVGKIISAQRLRLEKSGLLNPAGSKLSLGSTSANLTQNRAMEGPSALQANIRISPMALLFDKILPKIEPMLGELEDVSQAEKFLSQLCEYGNTMISEHGIEDAQEHLTKLFNVMPYYVEEFKYDLENNLDIIIKAFHKLDFENDIKGFLKFSIGEAHEFNNLHEVKIDDQGMLSIELDFASKWTLACLKELAPQIKELYIEDASSEDFKEGFRFIKEMVNLKVLDLEGIHDTELRDEDLAEISGLEDLEVFTLGVQNYISDKGLEYIANWKKLKILKLSASEVEGYGLKYLEGLTELVELHLEDAFYKEDNEGLKYIGKLKNLRILSLINATIKVEDLVHLKNLAGLEVLKLELFEKEEGLQHVGRLTNLQVLNLEGSNVTNKGLAHLKYLTNLKILILDSSSHATLEIDDEGLIHLSDLENLEELSLKKASIKGHGLIHLNNIKNLRKINLNGTKLIAENLAHLQNLTNLEDLNLGGTTIGDAGLELISKLVNLKNLSLEQTNISNNGLFHLSSLINLEVLNFQWNNINALIHLSALVNLRELNLVETEIDDNDLEYLKNLRNLLRLHLLKKLSYVVYKDLDVKQISEAKMEELKKAIPGLEIILS